VLRPYYVGDDEVRLQMAASAKSYQDSFASLRGSEGRVPRDRCLALSKPRETRRFDFPPTKTLCAFVVNIVRACCFLRVSLAGCSRLFLTLGFANDFLVISGGGAPEHLKAKLVLGQNETLLLRKNYELLTQLKCGHQHSAPSLRRFEAVRRSVTFFCTHAAM